MAVDEEAPAGGAGRESDVLAAAAAELRTHVDPGWVQVRSSALDRLRDAVRQAPPVRAEHPDGEFFVSGQVLRVGVLRAVAGVLGARPVHMAFAVADDGGLDVVMVQVAAAYGIPLQPLAHTVRAAVRAALVASLGSPGRRGDIDVGIIDVDRSLEEREPE